MQHRTDSAVAQLIDSYERAVQRVRPRSSWQPEQFFLGALFGLMAGLLGLIPLFMQHGPVGWWSLAAVTAGCGLFSGLLARGRWDRLYASCFTAQRQHVRGNLLEHEMLLLAMEEELPARCDKLRRVAQSHGKTRARNYMELRKGSMVDRIQWLVENYNVLCPPLGLTALTPTLASRRNRLQALQLVPLIVMGLGIVLLAVLQTQGVLRHIELIMPTILACGTLLLGANLGPLLEQRQVERAALLSAVVELLDLTDPAPEAADAIQTEEVTATEPAAARRRDAGQLH
jgi:hypothetical protein